MPRLFMLVPLLALSCRTPSHAHQHFDDADAWAARFEDPQRDAWQKPAEVISALHLSAEAKVADIGSATGYFPVRLAAAIPKGHVYGMDIESSMVDYLNKRAQQEDLPNLTSHLADVDDAKIPEPVDVILMVNTYHHLESRPAYFTRLKKSLVPNGQLAIIDFTAASKMGPPPELRIPVERVEAELKEAGYRLTARHTFLPEQHFLVFSPQGDGRE